MCVMCHAVFECDGAVDVESQSRLQRLANVFYSLLEFYSWYNVRVNSLKLKINLGKQ